MNDLSRHIRIRSALVAGFAVAGLHSSSPVVVEPVKFGYLPTGWRQFAFRPYLLRPAGTTVASFATSWPYRIDNPLGPAGAIPPNGVLIDVLMLRTAAGRQKTNLCHLMPHLPGYPLVAPPLRMSKSPSGVLEGRPRVKEYALRGRIDDSYNLEVRVDIDALRPSASTLEVARRVVAGLRFPRWPTPLHC